MPSEGQTAIGPNGERAVFINGQWVVQDAAPQMPSDPTYPYQGGKAAADLRNAVVNAEGNAIDNRVKNATAGDIIAKATADRRKAELDAASAADLARRGGLTPEQFDERQGRAARLNALIAQINRTQQLYNTGPGKTKGAFGIADYLPTDTNAAFDAAGASLSQQGLGAFRVPGTGTASDRDAIMFDRANLPTAATRDAAIEEQLRGLRSRVEEEAKALGIAPPQWQGLNAMDQTFVQQGGEVQATPFGSNNSVQQLPPAMREEYAAYVQQNAGRLDPAAYAAFRNQLNAKYGFQGDGTDYAKEAASLNEYYSKGGRTFGNIPDLPKKLSQSEQLQNNLANNPVTATAAGTINGVLPGALSYATGGKYDMLADARPYSNMAGEVLGSLVATKGIGGIGASTLGKIGPLSKLGGKMGSFGRNLATDATYGAYYGTGTEGDPLGGAVAGLVGSTLGQGVGSTLGRAAVGLAETPAAQYLRQQGINLTTGQRLGGIAQRVEDRAMSVPIVGDMIRQRRIDAFNDFNQAAFREAGSPVGASTGEIGMNGVASLKDQIGNAYDQATAGVNVPLDAQFPADLQAIGARSRMLPTDLSPRFNAAMDNAVQPIYNAGEMTGDAYQQAMRSLKGYKAETTKPGFEADYRGLLSDAQDALTGQMRRGGGSEVVAGLERANAAYRNAKTLEKAIAAAKNGTGSGELQVFTPAQLNTASYQSAAKYPGARPFAQLSDTAQGVLPSSVPDSGTGGRLLQFALPTALGGTAAGADAMGWDNTAKGIGLAALLSAGGTKGGQKLLNALLFERPKPLRDFGTLVRKNKGLFGSAAIPLAIEAGN